MTSILLTRPQTASQRFLDGLDATVRSRLTPVISPLIEIVALNETVDFEDVGGLIITSANGVASAVRLNAPRDIPCYCVGAETTRAATHAGWEAIMAGRNSSELVSALSELRPQRPLLHLGGKHRRGGIASRLSAAGCPTYEKAVYDQQLLPFTEQALTTLDGQAPVLVPLFSPRTARQFADLHKGRAPLFIAALSPAVVEPLKHLNYRELQVCDQPDAGSMTALVEKMSADGWRVEGDEAAH
mgnify:CR=1 FL=1